MCAEALRSRIKDTEHQEKKFPATYSKKNFIPRRKGSSDLSPCVTQLGLIFKQGCMIMSVKFFIVTENKNSKSGFIPRKKLSNNKRERYCFLKYLHKEKQRHNLFLYCRDNIKLII